MNRVQTLLRRGTIAGVTLLAGAFAGTAMAQKQLADDLIVLNAGQRAI